MRKIFFIHIAKTAGSSFNAFLRRNLNGEAHCEQYFVPGSCLRFQPSYINQLKAFDYISGHIKLDAFFTNDFIRENYCLATFLREPMSHLISHLNWLIRIYELDSDFFSAHPTEVKEASIRLRNADLYDAQTLMSLLQEPYFRVAFSNSQSRYFANCPEIVGSEFIIEKMAKLDAIGITERYADSLIMIADRATLEGCDFKCDRENQNRNPKIGKDILENEAIYEFLLGYNSIDLEIYHHFAHRFFVQTDRQDKKLQTCVT
jgi:hypothetical protein